LFKHLEIKQQLSITSVAFVITYFFLPPFWQLSTRLIFSWDLAVLIWLIMIWWMIVNATPQKMRSQARRLDAKGWIILILVVASAFASLLAIVLMLQQNKEVSEATRTFHFALSLITIVISWLLIHSLFAIHYAHLYYQAINNREALEFPQEKQPDYGDFLYFAWGIGMTCQVSDVQITSRLLRRVALVHQVLTFFFNTIILALSINILASLI
jgi:uncharacterized membrane protein